MLPYSGQKIAGFGDSNISLTDCSNNSRLPLWKFSVDRGIPLDLRGVYDQGCSITYKGHSFPSLHCGHPGYTIESINSVIADEIATTGAEWGFLEAGSNNYTSVLSGGAQAAIHDQQIALWNT